MKVRYLKFKDSIVINFSGKSITIHRDDPRYTEVLKAVAGNDLNKVPQLADNEAVEEIRNLLGFGKRNRNKP